MDVMEMTFNEESFGAILDKGTMDAIMCGENGIERMKIMLFQISRTLKMHDFWNKR